LGNALLQIGATIAAEICSFGSLFQTWRAVHGAEDRCNCQPSRHGELKWICRAIANSRIVFHRPMRLVTSVYITCSHETWFSRDELSPEIERRKLLSGKKNGLMRR